MLRLAERYGPERLEAACERARTFGDPSYRTVKGVLERGLDRRTMGEVRASPVAGAFLRRPHALLAAGMREEGGDE